jgi:hypothetical protein
MKPLALVCLASVVVCTQAGAAPEDEAVIAAMSLSTRPDYSWHTTIEDGTGSYVIDGKTNPHGYTWVRLPMFPALARRIGREGEPWIEAYFLGKRAGVVSAGDVWRTLAEMPAARERADHKAPLVRGSASAGNFGVSSAPLGAMTPLIANEKTGSRAYSPVHFGVSHPHQELAIIVSCAMALVTNSEIVTGTLSDTGAALLLVCDEQADVSPLSAAGEFKLWVSNGRVVKYQLKLEGVLAINHRKVAAHVNATTVLHDIGSTHLLVPNEVRAKLEQ